MEEAINGVTRRTSAPMTPAADTQPQGEGGAEDRARDLSGPAGFGRTTGELSCEQDDDTARQTVQVLRT